MRDTGTAAFLALIHKFTPPIMWMHLDALGSVTTGWGNPINSPMAAARLPWLHPDETYASRDEIIAAWAMVRNLADKRNHRGVLWSDAGSAAFAGVTRLRLGPQGVGELVRGTMDRHEEAMMGRYGSWESWPECAKVACMSLAWAHGSDCRFPKMDEALEERDFLSAAFELDVALLGPLGGRERANVILMMNAAYVEGNGLDPELVNWTSKLEVSEEVTQPDLTCVRDTEPPSVPSNSATNPTWYPGPKE